MRIAGTQGKRVGRLGERGAGLVFVGLALIVLLAVLALAVDLGILYVARSEAQRTADAAALAGANVFYTEGCVSGSGGCVAGGTQEGLAAAAAMSVASKNYVAGQAAKVNCPEYASPATGSSCPGISFNYPTPEEPQITVTVKRTDIPTIFARTFGISSGSVSATASAEAYSPEGGAGAGAPTPSTTTACVAPFLVPNCDPNSTQTPPANGVCPEYSTGVYPGYFANPNTTPVAIDYSAVGEEWTLHFGSGPSDAAVPSEWYLVAIWPAGNPSKSQERAAIMECVPVTCGEQLPAVTGKGVGPTDQGVEARINASGQSTGCPNNCNFSQGQDTITAEPGQNPPYQINAGASNPLVLAGDISSGAVIAPQQSPSVTTVALYDGAICGTTEPNGTVESTSNSDCIGPGGGTVTVVGWMTIFLQGYIHSGNNDGVQSMIMSITPCGSGVGVGTGTGGTPGTVAPIVGDGASPIPIRLIQHAG